IFAVPPKTQKLLDGLKSWCDQGWGRRTNHRLRSRIVFKRYELIDCLGRAGSPSKRLKSQYCGVKPSLSRLVRTPRSCSSVLGTVRLTFPSRSILGLESNAQGLR